MQQQQNTQAPQPDKKPGLTMHTHVRAGTYDRNNGNNGDGGNSTQSDLDLFG